MICVDLGWVLLGSASILIASGYYIAIFKVYE